MKVLICTGIFPPDIGGPATYSKLLLDELPKHQIDVVVLSFGEVRKLPKIIRHFVYFLKVLKLGKNVDVIYAQDPVSVGFPSALASKILRKKFILKIVGDYAWEQYQQSAVRMEEFHEKQHNFITEIRKKIERFSAKRANKIIVPSEYLKKIVLKWGVSENKISVVYNSFEMPKNIKRIELGKNVIISAGRLVPWKGFDVLIDIMPDILKQFSDAKLYIIGDGPDKEKLSALSSKFSVQDNVFLTGSLSHNELLSYLNSGDIFVLNTGYEGFSHLLLEAMSVGIPVVTTNIGGNPEIINNGINGVLVEYGNREELKSRILDLLGNEKMKELFVEGAKRKVAEFGRDRMIKDTINVLIK